MRKVLYFLTLLLLLSSKIVAQNCSLSAPTNLTVTQTNTTSIKSTWNAVVNAIGYQVQITNLSSTLNKSASNIYNIDKPQIVCTNLSPNTKYRIDVRAKCANGNISTNLSSREFEMSIVIDDVCMLTVPCRDNPQTDHYPFANNSVIPWSIDEEITINSGGNTMSIRLALVSGQYTAYVCKGTPVTGTGTWKDYVLGASSLRINPRSNQLEITHTSGATFDITRTYCPIRQVNGKVQNNSTKNNEIETMEKLRINEEAQLLSLDNFKISPNPFKDEFKIETRNSNIKEVIIFNQFGQVVKNLRYSENYNTQTIDTAELTPGFYNCLVKSDKKDFNFKVIKMD